MKELSDSIHALLYEKLTLQTAGLVVGVLLVLLHVWALMKPRETQDFLRKLPRNQTVGMVILTVAFIWGWVVAASMDMGEFARIRHIAIIAVPVMYVSLLLYTNEYLGARSLGALLILAACPLLDAAFLQPPQTRLFLVVLAYVWIILGLFWVGMPFVLRDQAAWVTKSDGRFKALALGGVVYGVVLVACALAFWGDAVRS